MTPERIPIEKVREMYARWWFAVETITTKFTNSEAGRDSEDLGDFVETIGTLLSFGPNPRTFPEHPYPFDPFTPE